MDWQRDLVVEVATQCRIIPRKILKHRRSMRTASGYHSTSRDGSRCRRNLRKGQYFKAPALLLPDGEDPNVWVKMNVASVDRISYSPAV
jgi:hypothetical protein